MKKEPTTQAAAFIGAYKNFGVIRPRSGKTAKVPELGEIQLDNRGSVTIHLSPNIIDITEIANSVHDKPPSQSAINPRKPPTSVPYKTFVEILRNGSNYRLGAYGGVDRAIIGEVRPTGNTDVLHTHVGYTRISGIAYPLSVRQIADHSQKLTGLAAEFPPTREELHFDRVHPGVGVGKTIATITPLKSEVRIKIHEPQAVEPFLTHIFAKPHLGYMSRRTR